MVVVPYIIMSVLAILMGQLVGHLNKKLPPVVSEAITYHEYFETFGQGFTWDIKYSAIFLILYNALIFFVGNSITIYLYAIVIAALAVTFSIDFRFQLIPDEVHIVIAACGFLHLGLDLSHWWSYLLGAIIGGGIFWGLGQLALLIFKKEGMGFGDVKLMAALGFLFGIKYTLVITLVSFVLGAVIGGTLILCKKKGADSYMAFGPFIVIAAIMLMFIPADSIIYIYISFCSWLGMKMSDAVFWIINVFST